MASTSGQDRGNIRQSGSGAGSQADSAAAGVACGWLPIGDNGSSGCTGAVASKLHENGPCKLAVGDCGVAVA